MYDVYTKYNVMVTISHSQCTWDFDANDYKIYFKFMLFCITQRILSDTLIKENISGFNLSTWSNQNDM